MSARRLLRPRIVGIRPGVLVGLYWWRLRRHGVQEVLAGGGIAIGVALFFGVLVASTSIGSSAAQLLRGITGSARLAVLARSQDGFSERLADRIGGLAGVRVAAPLLRENATVAGPTLPEGLNPRRELIQLVGVTASQTGLGAAATRNLGIGARRLAGGVGLPAGVAAAIGARAGGRVTLLVNGEAHSVAVRVVLGSRMVGLVAASPIVVALLGDAQALAGEPGRVTEVLVEPERGMDRRVRGELERLGAGRVDVQSAGHELGVLDATAKPTVQSTALFVVIGAMVGFLLALNAMLLSVPERRRFVAELRTQGFGSGQVVLVLASQAVVLGVVASVVGVLAGDLLAHALFREIPGYLTLAFPIGSTPVISSGVVLLALGCGVLASVLAAGTPVLDLRPGRPVDRVLHESGEAGQRIARGTVVSSGLIGACAIVAVTVVALWAPRLDLFATVVLALGALCLIPLVFALAVGVLRPVSERVRGSMLALAVIELEQTATRSVALAGVAALAVFGSVMLQGARHDLLSGLDSAAREYLDSADVWVTPASNDFLTIDRFNAATVRAAIARSPGVASVRVYQGSLLDVGERRLWIRARPPGDRTLIQASQLLEGDLARATRLIRAGGWVALPDEFAAEHHLRVGGSFALPTPSGSARLGVAAITTNGGWPPGAITLSTSDYGRFWQTRAPTALEVNLRAGVSPAAGRTAIEDAIGPRPGLQVQTFGERFAQDERSARQGVRSLSEIVTLLLVAAVLAIAFALSAGVWQRRARLASLQAQGFDRGRLWRGLLLESTILLAVGGLDGAVFGVYGHALADQYLRLSGGFPAPFSLGAPQILLTLVVVTALAVAVIALPGLAAASVSPSLSFQESP
jgi:putative ABC transport system permease protein